MVYASKEPLLSLLWYWLVGVLALVSPLLLLLLCPRN